MAVHSTDQVVIGVIQPIRRLVVDLAPIAEEVEVISVMDGCAPTVVNYVHMSTCLYVSFCYLSVWYVSTILYTVSQKK